MVSQNYLKFYKGKKVFVTGHTGFKGSWLLALLKYSGAIIKGYALQPEYKAGLFEILQSQNICESIIDDIRNKQKLTEELISFQPDIVFHLAAQPLVRRSYQIPAETFEVNVVGTANLLEAVNKLDKKCAVVVITTDKVYENKEQHIFYSEGDQLGGYDPYSASKACAELVVSSFRNSFFNVSKLESHHKALASARAGNVIGGGDWSEDRIIPDIIKSLSAQKTIDIRNPKAVRPWQHVLEPLTGYLLLAFKLYHNGADYSKAFNFGPAENDHLTVGELAEESIKSWGSGNLNDSSDHSQPHEANLLKLDVSLAGSALGWFPKLNAKEAIRWTIDWYKCDSDKKASFTFSQIEAFVNL